MKQVVYCLSLIFRNFVKSVFPCICLGLVSNVSIVKALIYRTAAALKTTKEKSASIARQKWLEEHQNELADGEEPPSKKFFSRQKEKMLAYGSVENRVCSYNLFDNRMIHFQVAKYTQLQNSSQHSYMQSLTSHIFYMALTTTLQFLLSVLTYRYSVMATELGCHCNPVACVATQWDEIPDIIQKYHKTFLGGI